MPEELKRIQETFDRIKGALNAGSEYAEVSEVMAIVKAVKASLDRVATESMKNDNKIMRSLESSLEALEEKIDSVNKKIDAKKGEKKKIIAEIKEYAEEMKRDIMESIPEIPDMALIQERHNQIEMEVSQYNSKMEVDMKKCSEDLANLREELREALEDLIKKFEEDIKKAIKNIPSGRGGGTSAPAVAHAFKYIAHTEVPTGAINGSNTVYRVENNIWWIAGFTLNGEQIAELPNFTYSGKTITFSTALPAAYSGKDFEIKYIGS